MYFILLNGVVHGVSFISLCDFSLLVYRNARDFCVLILYPAPLLNSLMRSSSFLITSLEFFYSSSVTVLLLFQFGFILILVFSHIVMARTSKTTLNKSGESGHTCLVPDLRGNAFSFSLLGKMLAVGLSYMAFIMLSYVPSMQNFIF